MNSDDPQHIEEYHPLQSEKNNRGSSRSHYSP